MEQFAVILLIVDLEIILKLKLKKQIILGRNKAQLFGSMCLDLVFGPDKSK